MSDVYLLDHRPVVPQYHSVRGRNPTGVIVVHTAQNTPDFNPPDDGAENVARFIATRTDSGSYHSICDSDGILHLGEYRWLMFGCRVGNAWSLHLSAACRTTDFAAPSPWVHALIVNMATEARNMADWCRTQFGIVVPARRISTAEFNAGRPGFIAHSEADPGWHSDPGPDFPWESFLSLYSQGDTPVATSNPYVKRMQDALNAAGVQPPLNPDGVAGPVTAKALDDVLAYQQFKMTEQATALRKIAAEATEAVG